MGEAKPGSSGPSGAASNSIATTAGSNEPSERPPVIGAVELHHEEMRKYLARFLMWVLAAMIGSTSVLILASKYLDVEVSDIGAVLLPFFTSIVTLVSTVVGFYFGSESAKSREGDHGGGRR